MVKKVPKKLLNNSRILRKKETPWESKLWLYLRNGYLGKKFKRQVRIGQYIVDFCCAKDKLIIELEGGHHNDIMQRKNDYVRERFLENEGYKVIKFWNIDIDKNIEGVLEEILNYNT